MNFSILELIGKEPGEIATAAGLSQSFIQAIVSGKLSPGQQLPPINQMASTTGLHRLTILKSMDELEIEGWIVKKERVGMFISEKLPVTMPSRLTRHANTSGTNRAVDPAEAEGRNKRPVTYNFSDGNPDCRFFPAAEYARAYSTAIKEYGQSNDLPYAEVKGSHDLRITLRDYLRRTRHLPCTIDNILISKGSAFGIYVAIKTLCRKGDTVVHSNPGYLPFGDLALSQGLKVGHVSGLKDGFDVDELEKILKRKPVKLIFITPHHHYPTTVTMPAKSRIRLLNLAEKYNFYILEDDYDFDYQYDRRPILPIASIDKLHRVIYFGSFSKALSPTIRLGFLLASTDLLEQLGEVRRQLDRHGDIIQEIGFKKLLDSGVVDRCIRKSVKQYALRRDATFELLRAHLSHVLEPIHCEGGLAFWVRFKLSDKEIQNFIEKARKDHIIIKPPDKFDINGGKHTRMGFANMNQEEMQKAILRLADIAAS